MARSVRCLFGHFLISVTTSDTTEYVYERIKVCNSAYCNNSITLLNKTCCNYLHIFFTISNCYWLETDLGSRQEHNKWVWGLRQGICKIYWGQQEWLQTGVLSACPVVRKPTCLLESAGVFLKFLYLDPNIRNSDLINMGVSWTVGFLKVPQVFLIHSPNKETLVQ